MPDIVIGFIGRKKNSHILTAMREHFQWQTREVHIDFYRTTEQDLSARLSELYALDRRGYVVSDELQEAILPFLDSIHPTDMPPTSVNTVVNDGGILKGYSFPSFQHMKEALCSAFP